MNKKKKKKREGVWNSMIIAEVGHFLKSHPNKFYEKIKALFKLEKAIDRGGDWALYYVFIFSP